MVHMYFQNAYYYVAEADIFRNYHFNSHISYNLVQRDTIFNILETYTDI